MDDRQVIKGKCLGVVAPFVIDSQKEQGIFAFSAPLPDSEEAKVKSA